MRRIKVSSVSEGLVPSEKVVKISARDGSFEELSLSVRQVEGQTIYASEIGRQDRNVLIELPRESASGKWRMWVDESLVLP
jgi:hypothetical protein